RRGESPALRQHLKPQSRANMETARHTRAGTSSTPLEPEEGPTAKQDPSVAVHRYRPRPPIARRRVQVPARFCWNGWWKSWLGYRMEDGKSGPPDRRAAQDLRQELIRASPARCST